VLVSAPRPAAQGAAARTGAVVQQGQLKDDVGVDVAHFAADFFFYSLLLQQLGGEKWDWAAVRK
jgi:hypothetical protein